MFQRFYKKNRLKLNNLERLLCLINKYSTFTIHILMVSIRTNLTIANIL